MRLLLVAILATCMAACTSKNGGILEVELSLKNMPAQKLRLYSNDMRNQSLAVDSFDYTGSGTAILRTKVTEPLYYYIEFDKAADSTQVTNQKMTFFIINGPGKVKLDGDFTKLRELNVTGSDDTKQLLSFYNNQKSIEDSIMNLVKQVETLPKKKSSDSAINAIRTQIQALENKYESNAIDLARNTKNPVLAARALFTLPTAESLLKAENLITSLNDKFPKSLYLKNSTELFNTKIADIRQQLQQQQQKAASDPAIGSFAPDFSMPDVNGKMVSLSSFRGKYVLVDFWASWCGPCREENPNVVAAYNKFKDKNFDILGVSLDRPGQKEQWLKAIANDKLTWTNVSDLSFWNSPVVKAYKIEGIPYNVLLDPSGKIIAASLRGEALEKKLAEVLK